MKRITMMALGVAACALVAGTTWAGSRYTYPLSLDLTDMNAQGQLADIRAESDSNARLTCRTTGYLTATPNMDCWGQNTASSGAIQSFYCSSSSASLIAAAQSITGDSFISVSWNSSGTCTELIVENASWASPKQP